MTCSEGYLQQGVIQANTCLWFFANRFGDEKSSPVQTFPFAWVGSGEPANRTNMRENDKYINLFKELKI